MKKYFVFASCLFLFVILSLSNAYACSCRGLEAVTPEDVQNNDKIFEGKVKKIVVDEKEYVQRITFKVTKWYKGEPTKGCKKRKVVVETASSSAACGLSVTKGDVWFLWAKKYGKDRPLSTNICSRSTLLPNKKLDEQNLDGRMKRYKADVAFLNRIAL